MSLVEIILTACITGLGAGLGSTVGAYFSNKLIVKQLDKIEEKLKVVRK